MKPATEARHQFGTGIAQKFEMRDFEESMAIIAMLFQRDFSSREKHQISDNDLRGRNFEVKSSN